MMQHRQEVLPTLLSNAHSNTEADYETLTYIQAKVWDCLPKPSLIIAQMNLQDTCWDLLTSLEIRTSS